MLAAEHHAARALRDGGGRVGGRTRGRRRAARRVLPRAGRAAGGPSGRHARRIYAAGTSRSTRSQCRSAARAGDELDSAQHALEDLAAGRLRVLHERSFIDDPTRLLRLARYRARLGFQIDAHTAELAGEALAAGALATVSRARIGAELRLALGEAGRAAALAALSELGVVSAIDPSLSFDRAARARALALLPEDGRADLLLMASLLLSRSRAARRGRRAGDVRASRRAGVHRAASASGCMRSALAAPSLVAELGARGQRRRSCATRCSRSRSRRSRSRARSAGADALGSARRDGSSGCATYACRSPATICSPRAFQPGPELGRRLNATLARKLDGELADGREAELSAALEASV